MGTVWMVAIGASATAQTPFNIPWNATGEGTASLRHLNPEPARQRIVAREGHLFNERGERVRFWGANIVGTSAFASKEVTDAAVKRLVMFGVNNVRLHHIDAWWLEENLFGPKPRETTRRLDPGIMDRLDYFIATCKAHGIYVNLNLLCSREFAPGDGLPEAFYSIPWKRSHQVGFWDAQARDLHKEFARQILTHRNAYTGLSYAEDPAICIVEINNEAGLLQAFYDDSLATMPDVYRDALTARWNDWLGRKYPTDAALRGAWGARQEAPGKTLAEGPSPAWLFSRQQDATGAITFGQDSAEIVVRTPGSAGWMIELHRLKLPVRKGQIYTLTFDARSNGERTISASVGLSREPWTRIGLSRPVPLRDDWQAFSFTFEGAADEPEARLSFGELAQEGARYAFRNVRLVEGGTLGVSDAYSLDRRNYPMVGVGEMAQATLGARKDYMAFLRDVEADYWHDMARFIREELNYPGLIVPTIVGVSSPLLMAPFDVVDAHGYWAHPNGQIVDPRSALSTPDNRVISRVAVKRIVGKPFFVTEYNHCLPNPHAFEGPLMLAAYAGLQDWDGVWYYCYSHSAEALQESHFRSIFEVLHHPAVMANWIPAALAFRRGDVKPADAWVTRTMTDAQEIDLLATVGSAWSNVNLSHLGVEQGTALRHRIGITIREDDAPRPQGQPLSRIGDSITSDTGQIVWEPNQQMRVDTPRTKMLVGQAEQATFQDGITWRQTGTPAFHSIALSALDDRPLLESKRILVVLGSKAMNTGMTYNEQMNSVDGRWGAPPTRIDDIAGTLRLPGAAGAIRVYALDPQGRRGTPVEVRVDGADALIPVGGHETLWYELARD